MSVSDNKQIAQEIIDAMNKADWMDHMHKYAGPDLDIAAMKEQQKLFRSAFPDYHFTVNMMIAEGDTVAIFGTVEATHAQEYPFVELKGVTPSGKKLRWDEAHCWKFENGKFVAGHFVVDGANRLRQLGVLAYDD